MINMSTTWWIVVQDICTVRSLRPADNACTCIRAFVCVLLLHLPRRMILIGKV